MNLAEVVLDIPTRSLDSPFSYLIPDELASQILVGSLVLVPFSGRTAVGYVVSTNGDTADSSVLEPSKLKAVKEVIGSPIFDEKQVALAFWMAHEYASPLPAVFRLFLPPGQTQAIAKAKKEGFEKSLRAPTQQEEGWVSLANPTSASTDDVTSEYDASTTLEGTAAQEERPSAQEECRGAHKRSPSEQEEEAGAQEELHVARKEPPVTQTEPPVANLNASTRESRSLSISVKRNAYRQQEILSALEAGPQKVSELAALIPGARAAIASLHKKGLIRKFSEYSSQTVQAQTCLSSAQATRPKHLTQGQTDALRQINTASSKQDGSSVLIKGVTGSGKSEVYLQAIEKVREQGKSAIVLVPEISLTAQTVGRFRNRFGDDIAIFHSRLTTKEKLCEWTRIHDGRAHVVIGARSALFAPLDNLGLIVIDEEHENSYKQDQAPRYVSRDVAKKMAELHGAALVLGSATPSLEALYKSQHSPDWSLALMTERPGGAALPHITIVDMKHALKEKGSTQVFSNDLKNALIQTYEAGEKSVLLLNRRGFATFLMCSDCGCVPECPHCSTSLTYHERTHELACHSCGRTWPLGFGQQALKCPNCGSSYLGAYGIGTQRVEDELASFLPEAPLFRMDADTTRKRGAHEEILEAFDAQERSILLGTQMIAKGLDFPEVTLVGVINADTTLKFPDFRASEKTFNLLEQVAGRAGRGERSGRVFIQTFWPNHPAIREVAQRDRSTFESIEQAERQEMYYPPFSRLGNIVISGANPNKVSTVVETFAACLKEKVAGRKGWQILGPAPCVKSKIKDRYRNHVLVKAPLGNDLGALFSAISRTIDTKGVSVALDVDAYDML